MERQRRFARKSGLRGVRFKARIEPGEAMLVKEVVAEVMQLLRTRLEAGEQDELAKITGIRSGNSEAPEYPPLARLVPDFLPPAGTPRARPRPEDSGEGGSGEGDLGEGTAADDGAGAGSGDGASAGDGTAPENSGPDAAEVDRENAAMRMLHEPEIVESKLIAGETLIRSVPSRGGSISLNEEQALAWLQSLNDVRLVLGELLIRAADAPGAADLGSNGAPRPGWYRAAVPEEMPAEDSKEFMPWQAYHWCAMMQEDLIEAMSS
ncbi:DUF2017 family protein [Dietzia sp.]|uniref:DUF2017 family protein n=1 Tax=Dietzia sp. TaxID=1871616 RepID=UPI002FDA1F07